MSVTSRKAPRVEPSDEQLATAAGRGDRTAFGALVERYRAPLVAYVAGIMGRDQDAEEVAQEALLRAWRHIGRLRQPERVGGWLHRITHNLAVSQMRKPRLVSLPANQALPTPASCDSSQPRGTAVAAAIGQLSEAHREVIWKKHFNGLKQDQIAAQLGVPPGTIRSRLSRAYDDLRKLLSKELEALEGEE